MFKRSFLALFAMVLVFSIASTVHSMTAHEYIHEAAKFVKKKEYKEAYATFENGLKEHPEDVNMLIGLGVTSALQGQYQESLGFYESVLKVNPDHMGALRGMAEGYIGLDQLDMAKTYLKEIDEKHPDNNVTSVYYHKIHPIEGHGK